MRLEGIEDVDLLDLVGFHYQNEYVQVKSADTSWNWSQLKKPLAGFLPIHRNDDANCGFVLAMGCPLTGDIEKLTQLESLSANERTRVENKFRNLCAQVGYSEAESNALLHKLTILSIPEEKIWQELKVTVAEKFGLGSEAVETYISTFVAKFLEWAKDRKAVTRLDLENFRGIVGEALARETEFQAYGQGLINRVIWMQDATPTDFFDGKGTRSGHIVAGLDIVRPIWIEKIDVALNASKICILRSSSGQGKSTLLYRYAYETRSPENIFVLRIAETPEQVELIRNYLQFRANLGLPILLLIDDVKWQTRLWASVAQQCAALDIRVLVTIRDEDWQRFTQESLTNYEILEPRLALDEGRQIFKLLKNQEKVHPSATSPEWAYEKIGAPHLLIEYVYLVTQGRMLEDRLRDQIRQISQQQEDPAKIEILRRTALAHALGTPVLVEKLLQTISFKGDPQQILQSLLGEYLQLENGMLTGLHWVRSNILAQILHEGFPNPASTALAIFEAIPSGNLASFISNSLSRKGLDAEEFLAGLIEKAQQVDVKSLITFLDGVFEAGERNFFESNRSLFDEAYQSFGSAVPFLISINLTPIIKVNILSEIIKNLGGQSENFCELNNIESKMIQAPRGLDLCRIFLNGVITFLDRVALKVDLDNTSRLLNWCALCQIYIPVWQEVKDDFFNNEKVFKLSLQSFCNFSQGLYRYDEASYQAWFSKYQEDILGYIKFSTDCLKLELKNNVVSIEFLIESEVDSSAHEATMSRLRYIRSAIPFCDLYQAKGNGLLPFGLKPSIDETHKNIQKQGLQFDSDISKNNIWFRIVQRNYLPDSYYKYQESWYLIRKDALLLVQTLLQALKKGCSGEQIPSKLLDELSQLIVRLEGELRYVPLVSEEDLEVISKNISSTLRQVFKQNLSRKWFNGFNTFIQQIIKYFRSQDISQKC